MLDSYCLFEIGSDHYLNYSVRYQETPKEVLGSFGHWSGMTMIVFDS